MVERIRTLLESRQLTPTQFADLIGVARPIVSHILSGRNKPSLEVVQRILVAMPNLAMPWLLNGSGPMLAATTSLASGAVTPAPPVQTFPVAASVSNQGSSSQSSENQHTLPAVQDVVAPRTPADTLAGRPTAQTAEHIGRVSKPVPFKPTTIPKRFITKPKPLVAGKSGESNKLEGRWHVEPAPEPVIAPASPSIIALAPDLSEAPRPGTDLLATKVSGPASSGAPTANAASGSAMAEALFAGAEKPIRRIVIFYRDGSFADYQPE